MAPAVTSIRKERDLKAREELILDHARRLLAEKGFQAWNMEQLAVAVEYSKGTLYQHFSSKEDLVLAVASRILNLRADLFEQAASFKGSTREQGRAIGLACCVFAHRHPDFFHIEMMLKSASFWEKASPERKEAHARAGARCWRTLYNIVVSAIALGDMPRLPWSAEHATMALISITIGSHVVSMEHNLRVFAGIDNPLLSVRLNQDLVCDGLGWKPLLHEHDYAATDQRIVSEIFPDAAAFLVPA